jgi:hypothetical protein
LLDATRSAATSPERCKIPKFALLWCTLIEVRSLLVQTCPRRPDQSLIYQKLKGFKWLAHFLHCLSHTATRQIGSANCSFTGGCIHEPR